MELDLLTAISPIDGRYRGKTDALAAYFSEFALIKYRVRVEIEYFIALCELPLPQLAGVDKGVFETLRNIYRNFSEADAQRIKEIESVTNHDVKAVEYFLKEQFDKLGGMDDYKEFIHFGLTSQDINNTSVPLSVKEALEQVYYPQIEELIAQLRTYAEEWANIPMLAKTHGQPASPTRLGKEIRTVCLHGASAQFTLFPDGYLQVAFHSYRHPAFPAADDFQFQRHVCKCVYRSGHEDRQLAECVAEQLEHCRLFYWMYHCHCSGYEGGSPEISFLAGLCTDRTFCSVHVF